jgi:GT2 family glycosyltransferase
MGLNDVDVSVVVPTSRRELEQLESIDRVLALNGLSIEVLAPQTTAPLPDPRIRYFPIPMTDGESIATARNAGAKLARGRYLHFLNSEDRLEDDALLALSRALDSAPQVGMAFGAIIPCGEDPAVIEHERALYREAARVARSLNSRLQLVANLLYCPPVLVNSACLYKRDCFLATGGFDTDLPEGEDIDLWARIVRTDDFIYLDRPIARCRAGAVPLSQTAWQHIRQKYRRKHGRGELLLLNAWAKTILRMRRL